MKYSLLRLNSVSTFSGQDQNEAEAVKQAFNLEKGSTMFHVINSFTRAAQEPGLSVSNAYRLETAGGRILALVK